MLIPSYPNFEYPTGDYTNGDILYNALGSFWTKIFNDKALLKGLTLGQSEEQAQRYYDVLEAINSLSASKIDVFHKEKWVPIRIKKSDFKQVGLLVGTDYFCGTQPDYPYSSIFFQKYTFKVGEDMANNLQLFRVPYDTNIKTISVFVDRVVSPALVLVNGIDFELADGFIYFNKDIFELSLSKLLTPVFAADGTEESIDEELILWSCHTEIDTSLLYTNLGFLFDFKLENTATYKDIILNTINLLTGGPTVKSLIALGCAFMGIQPVIEAEEKVEEVFVVGTTNYIVTDKHVYKSTYTINSNAVVGKIVYSGDLFFDIVEYFDNIAQPNWWETVFTPPADPDNLVSGEVSGLSLPNYLFCASSDHAFFFRNYTQPLLLHNNQIIFPVEGTPEAVAAFHAYINDTSRIEANKVALGFVDGLTYISDFNPLQFVFNEFLKYNSVCVKLNFQTLEQARLFTSYYSIIKKLLPSNVYIIFQLSFTLTTEEYENLNACTLTYLKTATIVRFVAESLTLNPDTNYYESIFNLSHGLVTGDVVNVVSTSATLPKGLEIGRLYKVIKVDSNYFQLTNYTTGSLIRFSDIGTPGASITVTKLTSSWTNGARVVKSIVNADGSDANGEIPNVSGIDEFKNAGPQRLFYTSLGIDLYTGAAIEAMGGGQIVDGEVIPEQWTTSMKIKPSMVLMFPIEFS